MLLQTIVLYLLIGGKSWQQNHEVNAFQFRQ